MQISKRRREFATDFGAQHTLDPSKVDVVKESADLTKGQGVDVCFDAAGVQVAVDYGLKSVKPRGTFVNIALWGAERVKLDMIVMLFGERKYMASKYYDRWNRIGSMLSGYSGHLYRRRFRRCNRSNSQGRFETKRHDYESYSTRRSGRRRIQVVG